MQHESVGPAKALLVIIAGGQLVANLNGNDGEAVTSSSGGRVTLNDSVLTYTPQITGVVESLVNVVKEAGGGRSHNTIQFTVL